MSYIVSYEPDLDHRYPPKKDQRRLLSVKKILLLILIFGGVYTFVRFGFVGYLIPGDPEVTKEAFSNMLDIVKEGESVGGAITAFVQDVLAGGR